MQLDYEIIDSRDQKLTQMHAPFEVHHHYKKCMVSEMPLCTTDVNIKWIRTVLMDVWRAFASRVQGMK